MLTLAPPHAAAEELSDKAAAALRRMLAVEPRNTTARKQPVAKVPAAFDRRRIPPDSVVRRLNMVNIRPPHALFGPGAASKNTGVSVRRGTFTTG